MIQEMKSLKFKNSMYSRFDHPGIGSFQPLN